MIKSKQGSALISALFIMTLIAITATGMSMRLMVEIYRTRLISNSDKLYLASQAVTFWSMGEMLNPAQLFHVQMPQGEVARFPGSKNIPEGVTLKGEIYDLQALFNINNLVNQSWLEVFQKLIATRIPKMPKSEVMDLVAETIYWLSPYHPDALHDNVIERYKNLSVPILPAYQSMSSASEFRLIQGVTQARFEALAPFITALPSTTRININTASPLMIKCLGHHLTDEKIAPLLLLRKKGIHQFKTIENLLKKYNIPMQQLTLDSEYFLVRADARMDDLNLTVYSILRRIKTVKGHLHVQLIRESINTL